MDTESSSFLIIFVLVTAACMLLILEYICNWFDMRESRTVSNIEYEDVMRNPNECDVEGICSERIIWLTEMAMSVISSAHDQSLRIQGHSVAAGCSWSWQAVVANRPARSTNVRMPGHSQS